MSRPFQALQTYFSERSEEFTPDHMRMAFLRDGQETRAYEVAAKFLTNRKRIENRLYVAGAAIGVVGAAALAAVIAGADAYAPAIMALPGALVTFLGGDLFGNKTAKRLWDLGGKKYTAVLNIRRQADPSENPEIERQYAQLVELLEIGVRKNRIRWTGPVSIQGTPAHG